MTNDPEGLLTDQGRLLCGIALGFFGGRGAARRFGVQSMGTRVRAFGSCDP